MWNCLQLLTCLNQGPSCIKACAAITLCCNCWLFLLNFTASCCSYCFEDILSNLFWHRGCEIAFSCLLVCSTKGSGNQGLSCIKACADITLRCNCWLFLLNFTASCCSYCFEDVLSNLTSWVWKEHSRYIFCLTLIFQLYCHPHTEISWADNITFFFTFDCQH